MLKFMKDASGSMGYPVLVIALLALVATGLLWGSGSAGASGLSCRVTDNVQINRFICSLVSNQVFAELE